MSISDNVKQIRTQQINEFMSQFDDLNGIDTQIIEEGLRRIIGEVPAVDFEYGVEYPLNERTGEQERKKKLSKIHIYYSYIDENNDVKASKVSYLVD